MKMAPSLLAALVLLSPPSEVLSASLTVSIVPQRKTLELSAQYRADNDLAWSAANDAGLLHLMAGSADSNPDTSPPAAVLELQSFALYALSRGAGLSESGLTALSGFRELLRSMQAEGHVVQVSEMRIGLEGETKICARFASSELAGKAWMQMQKSLVDADLVQLKPEKC